MKLEKNESEEKRLFTELQKTYDHRNDPTSEQAITEMAGQLSDQLAKLSKMVLKKRLEVDRQALESEVHFYEKILKKKVA